LIYHSLIVVIVIIVIQVEVPLDRPVAELDEENLSTTVTIGLAPQLLRIANIDAPLLEQGHGNEKFGVTHASIIVRVDAVEGDPQLVVLAEELEQPPEFSLRDIVVSVGLGGLDLGFGGLKGAHDYGFEGEEGWQAHHVTHGLVHLGQ